MARHRRDDQPTHNVMIATTELSPMTKTIDDNKYVSMLGDFYKLDETHGLSISDKDGIILFSNKTNETITGFSSGDLTGRSYLLTFSYLHDDDFFTAMLNALQEKKTWRGEMQNRHKNGSLIWLDATIVPVFHDNTPEGFISIATDITKYKNIEQLSHIELEHKNSRIENMQQIIKSSKRVFYMGSVAAGIAHEINNPMCFISANIHYLKDGIDKIRTVLSDYSLSNQENNLIDFIKNSRTDQFLYESEEAFADIENGLGRVAQITNDIKLFCLDESSMDNDVDITECIRQSMRMTAHLAGNHIEIVESIAPVPRIKGSYSGLCQVFVNLLTNSINAIGDHGSILVSSNQEDNGAMLLTVRDTGCGIEETYLERIFEPFFTTSNSGCLGLGLSFCADVIEAHGGSIRCISKPDMGAEIQIRLPTPDYTHTKDGDFFVTA